MTKVKPVVAIASHGGHLSELLDIVNLPQTEMTVVTYRSNRTVSLEGAVLVANIGKSLVSMLRASLVALEVIIQRPKVLISTGSEIAIPFFIAARIFGVQSIYIESCTRVRNPTRTALIVYHFANHFLVQSHELLARFGGKARFEGSLV